MNNNNQKHKELENYIKNNKNEIITILNLYIDSCIYDLEYIFNFYISDCIVDCVIICNTGHIIVVEIKPTPEHIDLRDAISQLSEYKQVFRNCPFKTLLKAFEDYPTLKQFIDTNKISEKLISEQYGKKNDYYTITFATNINNKLLNVYKDQLISQNLYNSFLIILNKKNELLHTYSIENNQINVNGKSIENLLKDASNEVVNQLNRTTMNRIITNTQILVSKSTLVEEIYSIINKIDKNSNLNYSIAQETVEYSNFSNFNANDEIEEMRKFLIEEFIKSKCSSINDFKEYITKNELLPSLYKIQSMFHTTNLTKIFLDGGYDIKRPRKNKNEENIKSDLIKKLQEIYEKYNTISTKILKQEGICTKIITHFGSIEKACEQADIQYIKNKRKNTMTKDDIIYTMNNIIIPEFTYENKLYTLKNISKYGITSNNIRIYFGSINKFKIFFKI